MNLLRFQWSPDKFNFKVNKTLNEKSKFDELIESKWNEAEKNSIFKYKLDIKISKVLDGNYGFFAQLNLDRARKRRTPENIESMKKPFDPNRFNFTKIKNEEIFFDVGDGTGSDVLIANVSPFEFGHCLFIPDRFLNLPQVITKKSITKVVELFLCSKSSYLRVVFNSLCAHASVNHLHWHFYYLKHRMFLEKIETVKFTELLESLEDYPSKGFCIKLSSFNEDNEKFSSFAFKIINYLQENEIAHNVYMTRAQKNPESEEEIFDDVRMYIWPRKSCLGVKDTTGFIPASCEFFGHLSIRSEECYEKLTEAAVAETFAGVTSDTFSKVQEDIKKFIDS